MKINALVFDMDGLLFDTEKIVQRSWNYAGEILGYGQVGEHIYHTLGFNVVRRGEYFQEHFGKDFPVEKFNQLASDRFYEITTTEGIPVKKGALELLEYGKAHGLKQIVATSSRRGYAQKFLEDTGIWAYLNGGIFGDMVHHAKPDPEIYRKACEAIGELPEHCMAFEDAPAGICSCFGAGLIPVMVPDLVQPSEDILQMCYQKVNDLTEVIPILDELLGTDKK